MYRLILILALLGSVATAGESAVWLQHERLPDVDGRVYQVRAARDDAALVLVFWTPWCGACAAEASTLVAAQKALGRRATFLGVVAGSDEMISERKVRAFINKHKLNYVNVRDRQLAITERLGVEGTPTILVIKSDGTVSYRGHSAPPSWNDVI